MPYLYYIPTMKITEILNNHGMITYSYSDNFMMRQGVCPNVLFLKKGTLLAKLDNMEDNAIMVIR